jgi:hypothetical protein
VIADDDRGDLNGHLLFLLERAATSLFNLRREIISPLGEMRNQEKARSFENGSTYALTHASGSVFSFKA